MEENRLPKLCFERLKELDRISDKGAQRNWFGQLRKWLTIIGEQDVIYKTEVDSVKEMLPDLIEKWKNHEISVDVQRAINSSYSTLYRHISGLGAPEQYVTYNSAIDKIRVVSQLRVSSDKIIRIWYRAGGYHSIDTQSVCNVCNLNKCETLEHFLLECPNYSPFRKRYFSEFIADKDDIHWLLNIQNRNHLDKMYFFIIAALKLRSFCLNE
uniref:Reverse transcriptase zinc-binding domain-containing protein n=1 Tax=Rhodnius prolixus TaxID=13249 RepID=T1H8C6_RHOPR